MPLFISEEELRLYAGDAAMVADKADGFIRELYSQIETVKAEADAASITREQTCSLIEQRYVSLSEEHSSLQVQLTELNSSFEQRNLEIDRIQAEKQQLILQSIEKDGEIERLRREASELHKSKRQLMELVEQKDLEISEKNANVKSYLDKILTLSENVASKDARMGELESELARLQATSARTSQEKELLERHNAWLNEELTAKVDSLVQLRKANGELEADMSSKLVDAEKKVKDSFSSLKLQKDKVQGLEDKVASLENALLETKDAAAAAEERFSVEISTANKLVDLYKESSEELSKKAGDLEGVIKALETHLNQVESSYKERLEKEESAKKDAEKESCDLKQKLEASQAELENLKKENNLRHLPLSSFTTESWLNSVDTNDTIEDNRAIVPRIPAGVSGTALAASLLRDGWTLAKIYAKYQEAVDAFRHEQMGRKQSQAMLERVLYEIEEKAGEIMDEREEHERLVEAYSALDKKHQNSLAEYSALQTTIHELKASLKGQERDYAIAQKEIVDLQKQVAILLKECRDIQLRCGSGARHDDDELVAQPALPFNAESTTESVISERLLTFKDINGLVEHNVQLRSLVRKLSHQYEDKETELKEKYEYELEKHNEETVSKVNTVLKRAEEQAQMIESLHTSVSMYKKLYEEEHKLRIHPSQQLALPDVAEQGNRGIVVLHESNNDTLEKVQEQAFERLKNLEEDLAQSRNEIISLRAERDKFELEAQFAREKFERFMAEFEHQRKEHNGVLSRNVEFSQLIVDYQKKLRESAESSEVASELSRKLTMEVSLLKHEKEILQNSERRASDEVRSLSERVQRLQASLDTLQSTEEVREEARGIERRKQEEYINKIEREWAEAKKELQEERDAVRNLTLERENNLKSALRQVEELHKELANALHSVTIAESRAAVAEARCSDLEKILESAGTKNSDGGEGAPSSSSDKLLATFRDEIEKLRMEAQSSNEHMLQYKNIAQVNEEALKQIESAYQNLKTEAEDVKRSLEAEFHSLRDSFNELESECKLRTEEAISATSGKDEALASALAEIASLKDECSAKVNQITVLESQMSTLRGDLENEHQRWRNAQDNYERQVILQSETIQELTKTSQALASAQDETSELRKMVDVLKTENNELKSKWETEKLAIEVYRNEADKKYNEINELNKILHNRLDTLHIKRADRERGMASGGSQNLADDDGLQSIVNYLRRSKEIAETEISLLKQEKLRLQSQLEVALRSAEVTQATLHTEREKLRSSVFSEEEFKSLQIQVSELTLLRESNMQLREENRHNFKECQKLREELSNAKIETENFEKVIRDKDSELEVHRKEIDTLKMEKGHLENRIDELVQKCKDIDVDDYNRLKESVQQMEASLKEKDAQLEAINKLLAEKHESISLLEQDLARSKTESSERETRITELVQTETSLRSDTEKHKRVVIMERRKYNGVLKEKEELIKEIQNLSKQLEDAKQVKRVDTAGEQAQREKEKEKDTRIQILERTLERHREDLRKEKEDHNKEKEKRLKIRKTIMDSREIVAQEKTKISEELSKHKESIKALQDEVEKLKNSAGGQSEVVTSIQQVSAGQIDDSASGYFHAVDNFEQIAQPACSELDSIAPEAPVETTLAVSSSSQAAAANVPLISRTNEEKERRLAVPKFGAKMARKLHRPIMSKPKEPQGDVDMPEADEPNPSLQSHIIESQGNTSVPVSTSAPLRKRPSSDLQDEALAPEETSPDTVPPVLKKSKGSDQSLQEGGEEASAPPTTSTKPSEVEAEETQDDAGSLDQGVDKDENFDAERDEFEAAIGHAEEPAVDEQNQADQLMETGDTVDEKTDKPTETSLSDDPMRDQTEQDIQQVVDSGIEREEGELGDFADNDGDLSSDVAGQGIGEFQTEQSADPENSPGTEPGEIEPEEEKNSDTTESIPISSNKPATTENIPDNSNKPATTENNPDSSSKPATEGASADVLIERAPGSSSTTTTTITEEASMVTSVDVASSEQGGSTPPPDKPVSPANNISTTINLQERARQRAHLRQAGMVSASPSRGRGRPMRARGARGVGRPPSRGQSPG